MARSADEETKWLGNADQRLELSSGTHGISVKYAVDWT